MKKILTVALALSMAAAFSGMAFAARAARASKPMAHMTAVHKKVAYKMFKGSVVSVDPTANSIVVKGKKGEETFAVGPTTKLTLRKKAATLADFVAGTKVSVSYSVDNGKNVASAIR
jgi:Cu/Ag efflux protein CusF